MKLIHSARVIGSSENLAPYIVDVQIVKWWPKRLGGKTMAVVAAAKAIEERFRADFDFGEANCIHRKAVNRNHLYTVTFKNAKVVTR